MGAVQGIEPAVLRFGTDELIPITLGFNGSRRRDAPTEPDRDAGRQVGRVSRWRKIEAASLCDFDRRCRCNQDVAQKSEGAVMSRRLTNEEREMFAESEYLDEQNAKALDKSA